MLKIQRRLLNIIIYPLCLILNILHVSCETAKYFYVMLKAEIDSDNRVFIKDWNRQV